jgi:trehalose-6-phosphate synthase
VLFPWCENRRNFRRLGRQTRVYRLDYSKGIALRMEAFDRFLSTHRQTPRAKQRCTDSSRLSCGGENMQLRHKSHQAKECL